MKKYFILSIIMGILLACGQQTSTDNEESNATADNKEVTPRNDISETIDKSEGAKLFILCMACHDLKEETVNKVGPNLHNFMGKKAGFKENFKYSEQLLSSGIVWDRENLRKWIENPAELVPGTSMAFIGIEDKAKQDILIDYLIEQTK